MNNELDSLERLRLFFVNSPQYFGIVIVLFGVVMLLAAIKNREWIFHGRSFNTQKLEGISNMWGRGAARFIAGTGGLICIISGIVWFVIHVFYKY